MEIIWLILVFGVGVLVGRWSVQRAKSGADLEIPHQEDTEAIMALFDDNEQIQNSDVREALDVSEATATRYLDALQQRGLLTQQGKTGRNTFYTKN